MTAAFGIIGVFTLFIVITIIPRAVEISDTSEKFLKYKTATNHTFNRSSRKYYYFLKWGSKQMLPMRFGTYFVISVETPINYLEVLMINLTNATLLISPYVEVSKKFTRHFQ